MRAHLVKLRNTLQAKMCDEFSCSACGAITALPDYESKNISFCPQCGNKLHRNPKTHENVIEEQE